MDFGFTAELALQYAVSTVLTALVSWVSVNFVNRVLETIDIENANRLRNLAERFHDLVTSRAFTMVVAEAMKLDADPESAREQLYNMRNVLVQRMQHPNSAVPASRLLHPDLVVRHSTAQPRSQRLFKPKR